MLASQVWLKQPLVSVDDIRTRHDVVEAFVSDPELRERLRDQHLRGEPSPLASLSIMVAVLHIEVDAFCGNLQAMQSARVHVLAV